MTPKAFSIRPKADVDFDEATDRYILEAGMVVAGRFLDAVEDAHCLIAETPGAGSPALGPQVEIDGLRVWKVSGFPYLVVYLETALSVDVVRLLHAHRDVVSELLQDLG